ncbi:MAG: VanW family protein [archaeon]
MSELEEKKVRKKGSKILITITIVIVAIFIALFASASIYIYANSNVFYGVKVGSVDLGGLSKDDLRQKLNSVFSDFAKNGQITVVAGTEKFIVTTKELNASVNIDNLSEKVYDVGRSGNLLDRLKDFISITFKPVEVSTLVTFDKVALQNKIDEFALKSSTPKQFSFSTDTVNKKIIMTTGIPGQKVDTQKLKSMFMQQLNSLKLGSIQLETTPVKPNRVDPEKVYLALSNEATNAQVVYKNGAPTYTAEKYGTVVDKRTFLSAYNSIKNQSGRTIEIPAKIVVPPVTSKHLKNKLFADTLGAYHTTFSDSSTIQRNRGQNIRLACKKMNGKIINPGEVFSYNKTVGPRNAKTGFAQAYAYYNGEIVIDYGGGVCQTSSTLYNCVLLADLQVVYRKNHTFLVGYAPGRDATVSYPEVDFTFKNTSPFPIKILASTKGVELYMSIQGMKTPNVNKRVVLSTSTISHDPYHTVTTHTSTMKKGTWKYIHAAPGHDGWVIDLYRTIYVNGKKTSSGVVHRSTYRRYDVIVQEGTG